MAPFVNRRNRSLQSLKPDTAFTNLQENRTNRLVANNPQPKYYPLQRLAVIEVIDRDVSQSMGMVKGMVLMVSSTTPRTVSRYALTSGSVGQS